MVHDAVVFDISSSDDEDEDRHGSIGLSPNFSKVFHMDAEDDDVVIIDKPRVAGSVKRDKARPMRPTSVMDDDECCMLDTDPGATETTDIVPPLDSDELVMTGEKGPVACRDFPHARYLCVHYPFKTTLHAKFCAQCHCYVCDSLAPCIRWGDGSSSYDHCHASEDPRWKALRKLAKCGSVPPRATPSPVTPPMTVPSPAPTPGPVSSLNRSGNPTGVNRFVHSGVLLGLNRSGNPTGVNRFVHSGVLLDTSGTSPITHSATTHSPGGHRVGSGASRQVQSSKTTASGKKDPLKKDPLVISLKSKARGKPSHPPHLGVRSPGPHPVLRRSAPPSPRTSSSAAPSSGRIGDHEISPPGVDPPHFASYPNPGPGGAGRAGIVSGNMPPHHSVPTFKAVPGRAGGVTPFFSPPPPVPSDNPPPRHLSRTTVHSEAVPSYYPGAPPLPNSPPPYIPPPPPGAHSPGAYAHPPPPAGVFDHTSVRPGPSADPTAAHIPQDSRYVSASALSAQQVDCDVNAAPCYEDHQQYYGYLDHTRSPLDSAHCPSASSTYISSNGGHADILAGATEGWLEDATAHLNNSFGHGIPGTGTGTDHESPPAASSLNDVLQQMAGDDYLWEQFSCW